MKVFNIFWNIEEDIDTNKKAINLNITPKFGKVGIFIWFVIEKAIDLCKTIIIQR